ncbi:flagellin [Reinekea marinisedimentorum]|uniref:Flagellin n=1 Tax=Reinekea marinisedimentorum TaxID=230495 RepID=A0A4R3I7T7_9GAMM|nr:flagellin [Reinekea marinisedimentorum]TCS42107.1 flagellin [Reinekea marinisedimentorum]
MALVINTNMASLTAQRNLTSSQSDYNTSLERLSSGLRINSAKDDAAGLAISTRFESQITGLDQAVRNANDGVSLAQTAEGALDSMTDNLQRIRELAVQASNSTNSDDDRVALQAEVEQLLAEITRTAEDTNFNGQNLLDGTFEGVFQVGADAGQTVSFSITEMNAGALGTSAQAGVSAIGVGSALENGDLSINGEDIRASVASDDTLSYADNEMSGIAKAAAINDSSDETGVTATVDANVMLGSDMSAVTADASGGDDITLNGVTISLQGTDNTDATDRAATRDSVIAAINAVSGQTGVTAEDGGDDGGVILTAEDGRNITIESAEVDLSQYGLFDSDVAAADTDTSYAGFTMTAKNSSVDIEITGGNGTGNGDISNSGLAAGTYDSQTAVVTTTNTALAAQADGTAATSAALQDGDLVINGVTIGASSSLDDTASETSANSSDAAASGIAIAAAINEVSDSTGVSATVNATEFVGDTAVAGAGGTAGQTLVLTLNGVDITLTETGDYESNKQAAVDAINAVSGQTGVVAEDNGETLTLTAEDGRNISTYGDETGLAVVENFGLDGVDAGAAANAATTGNTTYSTVTLTSASSFEISYGTNGSDGLDDSGFTAGTYGGGEDGTYLSDIDISTFEGAQAAITAIDNALDVVTAQQADLGAIQNRFESTVMNLEVTQENLTAAQSAIQDADFAEETAEMTRTSVLQQAGISVLSQANSQSQNVLSLLG